MGHGRFTRHSPEVYEHAMSLRGKCSEGMAQIKTGVPKGTIHAWWHGTTPNFKGHPTLRGAKFPPRTHCKRGHPLKGDNVHVNRATGRRQCRKCKRRADLVYYRRQNGIYDERLNPDPAVAPFHNLWLPGADVLAYIRENWSDEAVIRQLDDKNCAPMKRFYELRKGKAWIRFDAADALCVALGLVASAIGNPVYSKSIPQEAPCSLDSQAA